MEWDRPETLNMRCALSGNLRIFLGQGSVASDLTQKTDHTCKQLKTDKERRSVKTGFQWTLLGAPGLTTTSGSGLLALLLGARTLLGALGLATRNKKLLVALGLTTRSQDATRGSMEFYLTFSFSQARPQFVPLGAPRCLASSSLVHSGPVVWSSWACQWFRSFLL